MQNSGIRYAPFDFWREIPVLMEWLKHLQEAGESRAGCILDADGNPVKIRTAIRFLEGLIQKRSTFLN